MARPWRWGNPFVVGDIGYREYGSRHEYVVTSAATAVAMHRQWLGGREFVTGFDRPTLKEIHACLAQATTCAAGVRSTRHATATHCSGSPTREQTRR